MVFADGFMPTKKGNDDATRFLGNDRDLRVSFAGGWVSSGCAAPA
jgi:hypothetical protein